MEKVEEKQGKMEEKERKSVYLFQNGGCSFVKVRNNLFRAEMIKSVRVEGNSLKFYLVEQMYARVEFDSQEKASECWQSLQRSLGMKRSARVAERGVEEMASGTEANEKKGSWWRRFFKS